MSVPLVLLIGALSAHAQAPNLGVHEHGVADLNLVRAGEDLVVELISPAFNFLGFERQAVDHLEIQARDDASALLRSGAWLTTASACTLVSAELSTGDEASHEEHAHDHHDHAHHDHVQQDHHDEIEGHRDWRLSMQWQCSADAFEFDVATLFSRFSQLERLRVQALGAIDAPAVLTRTESKLAFAAAP